MNAPAFYTCCVCSVASPHVEVIDATAPAVHTSHNGVCVLVIVFLSNTPAVVRFHSATLTTTPASFSFLWGGARGPPEAPCAAQQCGNANG